MTPRTKLRWKLLLAFFVAGACASLAAWAIVAATLCSNPRQPVPETQHVIAYNCHGMTVFLSPFQEAMRHWLIPLFVFLSLVTGAMLLLARVKVRINVQIHRTDSSSGTAHREKAGD